jgi:hypothetical protein
MVWKSDAALGGPKNFDSGKIILAPTGAILLAMGVLKRKSTCG